MGAAATGGCQGQGCPYAGWLGMVPGQLQIKVTSGGKMSAERGGGLPQEVICVYKLLLAMASVCICSCGCKRCHCVEPACPPACLPACLRPCLSPPAGVPSESCCLPAAVVEASLHGYLVFRRIECVAAAAATNSLRYAGEQEHSHRTPTWMHGWEELASPEAWYAGLLSCYSLLLLANMWTAGLREIACV